MREFREGGKVLKWDVQMGTVRGEKLVDSTCLLSLVVMPETLCTLRHASMSATPGAVRPAACSRTCSLSLRRSSPPRPPAARRPWATTRSDSAATDALPVADAALLDAAFGRRGRCRSRARRGRGPGGAPRLGRRRGGRRLQLHTATGRYCTQGMATSRLLPAPPADADGRTALHWAAARGDAALCAALVAV